jgi:hypothetical protein
MLVLSLLVMTGNIYGQTNQPPPVPSEETPEVQTRGPLNEGFAQPVTIEENSNFTVPKAPPADINEIPPAERPVGDQFTWIPGYWAWDSERNEHIWVSGCWRAVPPGKYWVPGYWAKTEGGYRWVPGFWASNSEREIEYLPPPPAITYIEPEDADRPDMIWVPACWYWSNGRYTLRSGYWLQAREDWVWIPSHYVWTPRGYIFVRGHWDYPLVRRGVLFAPVHFRGNIYGGHRLSYSLSIVLDLGNFEFGLFTRPGYRHYYFGDYYDDFYIGIGIFPWFECVSRRTWYDPIYLHNRWNHRRHNHDWWQHEIREYERRRADKDLRPPRTYHEMERRIKGMPETRKRNFEVAAPMQRVIENKNSYFRYRKDKPEEHRQILRRADDVQKYSMERNRRESQDNKEINNRYLMDNGTNYSRERIRMQLPDNNKRRDLPPFEDKKSDVPFEKKESDSGSYNGRIMQKPLEQGNMDQQPFERGETKRPAIRNIPDENLQKEERTSYPRPVRQKENKGSSYNTPVQKNTTENLKPGELRNNSENLSRPSLKIDDRHRDEFIQKRASSQQDEEGEVRKARPRIEKIKR